VSRKYSNPPLVEMVCEFRFRSEDEWDWTIPGLMFDKIRKEFPHKRERKVLNLTISSQGEPSPDMETIKSGKASIDRLQFIREDQKALIQIGPDLLTVNHLSPHPDWKSFRTSAMEQVKIYRDIANPLSLERIGLRYINAITINKPTFDLETYFVVRPTWDEAHTSKDSSSIFIRATLFYHDPEMRLTFSLSSTPSKPEDSRFLFDLDAFSDTETAPTFEQSEDWLNVAHDRLNSFFDYAFTDRAHKELFQEETS
jgi:uncharacterized protein (TIGR04255 family)